MPDDPNDDLKQKTERTKAQTLLVQVDAELAKAKAALAETSRPPDVGAVADAAEKARLAAETLDARKALADSTNLEGAKRCSEWSAIPASNGTGQVRNRKG
jgi:hypothetical protein